MVKKTGLGRGINNFIKDTDAVDKLLNNGFNKELQIIKIEEIKVNENQARKDFNQEALEELSESIREYGIIQPIVLRKISDGYTIIAGERRFRAAKMANLKEIPAIVKDITEEEADKISLIENIQRVDLNPIEEALGYKSILSSYKMTQEELANALGKSRQYIGNTIRLLKLDPRVIEFMKEGLLSTSHGKLLLSIKDFEQQYKEAQRIIKSGNTVKESRDLLGKKNKKEDVKDIFLDKAQRDLSKALGTKVSFKARGKKKNIVIEYYNEEDLIRIYETILGSEN
ncbi:MAG: ParB/RepB/Spo0J family partition protein [Peptoniphilaceae bacterium]